MIKCRHKGDRLAETYLKKYVTIETRPMCNDEVGSQYKPGICCNNYFTETCVECVLAIEGQ